MSSHSSLAQRAVHLLLAILTLMLQGTRLANGATFGSSVSLFGVTTFGQYSYVLYDSPQIFQTAEIACGTLVGGHLASATSDAEWHIISNILLQFYQHNQSSFDANQGYGACLWIGLTNLQASPDPVMWTSGDSVTWFRSSVEKGDQGLVSQAAWAPRYNKYTSASRVCSSARGTILMGDAEYSMLPFLCKTLHSVAGPVIPVAPPRPPLQPTPPLLSTPPPHPPSPRPPSPAPLPPVGDPRPPPRPPTLPTSCVLANSDGDLFCIYPAAQNVLLSWSDASNMCNLFGAQLAWVSNSAEQLLLQPLLGSSGTYWTQGLHAGIGLTSSPTAIVNYNAANASYFNSIEVGSPPGTTVLAAAGVSLPVGSCLAGGGCALAVHAPNAAGLTVLYQYMDAGNQLAPLCRTNPQASTPAPVNTHLLTALLSLTLNMDFSLIASESAMVIFRRRLDNNLAQALGLPSGDVEVLSVSAGSVVAQASAVLPPDVLTSDQVEQYVDGFSRSGDLPMPGEFLSAFGIDGVQLVLVSLSGGDRGPAEPGGDETTAHLGIWLGLGLGLGIPLAACLGWLFLKVWRNDRMGYELQKNIALAEH